MATAARARPERPTSSPRRRRPPPLRPPPHGGLDRPVDLGHQHRRVGHDRSPSRVVRIRASPRLTRLRTGRRRHAERTGQVGVGRLAQDVRGHGVALLGRQRVERPTERSVRARRVSERLDALQRRVPQRGRLDAQRRRARSSARPRRHVSSVRLRAMPSSQPAAASRSPRKRCAFSRAVAKRLRHQVGGQLRIADPRASRRRPRAPRSAGRSRRTPRGSRAARASSSPSGRGSRRSSMQAEHAPGGRRVTRPARSVRRLPYLRRSPEYRGTERPAKSGEDPGAVPQR